MAELHPSRRFYMVCRAPKHPGSKTEPRTRYKDHAEAEGVARSLAKTEGAAFIVLEAVAVYGPEDATQQTLI